MGIMRCWFCVISRCLLSLVYIIISPIAIYEKIPNHYESDGDAKRGVFCHKLGGICGPIRHSLKNAFHGWFNIMKDRDANDNPGCIDRKEHAQLVQDMPRARFGIGPKTVACEIVNDRTQKGNSARVHQSHGEKACEKIHDSKVKNRANSSYRSKL